MANVPTIVVGTGNQQKVVTPALLTGLDSNGTIVALRVDGSGNLLTSGLTGVTASTTVANDAARYALTSATVSVGGLVYVTSSGAYYKVVSTSNLSNSSGYRFLPNYGADNKLPSIHLPDSIDARLSILSGTTAGLNAASLAENELAVNTDTKTIVYGNGLGSFENPNAPTDSGISITGYPSYVPIKTYSVIPARDVVVNGVTLAKANKVWIDVLPIPNESVAGLGVTASVVIDGISGITGAFSTINSLALTSLSVPELTYVGGNCSPAGLSALTSLSLPKLAYVGGNFSPLNLIAITSLSFPKLAYVGGSCSPSGGNGLLSTTTTLNFPELQYVISTFGAALFPLLTNFNFPKLSYIGGSFNPNIMAALTTMSLPELNYVGGSFVCNGMAALTSISLPKLAYVGADFNPSSMASLTTISFGTGVFKKLGGNFTMTGMALTAQSVENILVALAYMDGTNGTVAFSSGKTINLSGGTSSGVAGLTGPAAAARTTLLARGVTVTLNA